MQIGGGVHVGDASTSDCRFKTHSNMGMVALCLNVSKRDPSANERHLETTPTRVIGEAGRTNSADGQDIGDFSRGCLQDTQDLAVSNHGRTGRYHVLRTERGIETGFPFQRCRFKSVGHPASRV
ncbi:bll0831 [Bradyrhizobium diazoefficiens USDA 110]|uniref:Bll0831 protein n=1 Tax=Bradyrhizobium diazoefficiens (strain JCM 10833 / BCRC 13528 / IAM 13628 / NBRC 14792 / USDA 110) TaxID=224911 RepID=Q89W62_BRADU|nr:hypothetical protein CO678_07595 [Bradyrhizobium diazoefficiens]QBP19777.1 hypothetical protein Bdiaspc4_03950 [Bradyrhizobium diazoefficiens]QHP67176.1 hypothetical protein EI171_06895 [Bradyrhizobium sp. LCT2]BAC46096.1 bll0831 [Bradyrhizobium diazoefficiens USDA 110]